MKKKKYQLHNSYFKVSKRLGLPDTILEIAKFKEESGELPFNYSGNNWVYDAFCERQKYNGIKMSQYLTSDYTVDRMLHFAGKYFEDVWVLEPCCGTGQITKELLKDGYNVAAFDIDQEMIDLCKMLYPDHSNIFEMSDFKDYSFQHNQIIANPPYEMPEMALFMAWVLETLPFSGIAILLTPQGFIQKDKPKVLREILKQFGILEREDVSEPFARTMIRAEIVVLKKI